MWTPCEISYFWWWFFPAFLMVLGRIWGGFGMILWPCSRNGSLGSMMPTTGCNRCTKPPRNIRSSRLLSVCRICWSDKIWCYFPDSTSILFFGFFFPQRNLWWVLGFFHSKSTVLLKSGELLSSTRYMSVFEEELVRLHDDLRRHPGKYARPGAWAW